MVNWDQIKVEALEKINSLTSLTEIEQFKIYYFGKNGMITKLMKTLKEIPLEKRKEFGNQINTLKNDLESQLTATKEFINQLELEKLLITEAIDVTLPGREIRYGTLHPITSTYTRIIKIFAQFGFAVADGPEIENDYYNFAALNVPAKHPARAMQDTFYTDSGNVLRTHTSSIQIRHAETKTPPIKIIAPGRAYRVDMDATHSPMFHQLEVLWIDKSLSFSNLKALVIDFMKKFFEDDNLAVRFRASFFPFTEPSAEIDVFFKKTGKWLEVGGCGLVHPNVLNSMNIDPDHYNGLACGFGVDRLTMFKYGITDLRLLFENDLDFLKQFKAI